MHAFVEGVASAVCCSVYVCAEVSKVFHDLDFVCAVGVYSRFLSRSLTSPFEQAGVATSKDFVLSSVFRLLSKISNHGSCFEPSLR